MATEPLVTTAEPLITKTKPVPGTPAKTVSSDWFLYLIRCGGGELYTGITKDVARRFAEHSAGGPKAAKYLRGRGPLALVYQERVGSRSDALRRELALKRLSKCAKETLVAGLSP